MYGANGICGYTDSPAINGDAILIVKDGSGVGNVSYAQGEYSVIGTSNYLTAKNGYSLRYLYYSLMKFNFAPYKTGMAIPHIYFKDYGKAKIYCPSLEEQERIASNLFKIERKIEIERSIKDCCIAQKQYLLQQMFIWTFAKEGIALIIVTCLKLKIQLPLVYWLNWDNHIVSSAP